MRCGLPPVPLKNAMKGHTVKIGYRIFLLQKNRKVRLKTYEMHINPSAWPGFHATLAKTTGRRGRSHAHNHAYARARAPLASAQTCTQAHWHTGTRALIHTHTLLVESEEERGERERESLKERERE